ncbi:N-glycosylase/DNA lyase [Coprinopsis cinerea okayama7|uniref:DNA-(apurinic or apyrimidinic site) lyase n=1 Tax=Coprinopsis cinerea (strain Okayama-7 / 130 / ATCC MYA-4618 / FGSC 9003) TaxID=240176 RepID=A8NEU7_COPC7|nr:N-glycosylase/DNA lyase [Coprinopsis cinerea okayama7\|eukprot:XP_001833132.2 N-glycosylase/DNA lyase [Coprinopsis cinerea okayama7\
MALTGFQQLPLSVTQLSLAAVLKCGQSFRWSIIPLPESTSDESGIPCHEYRLCLKDRVVCLRQSPSTLYYRSAFPDPQPPLSKRTIHEAETLAWLRDYFQLDVDLESLYAEWASRDKVFAKVKDRFSGIRILRQDPWENLVSFICSSNNNISRITKMVHNLCQHYSPPLLSLPDPCNPSENLSYHPFPPPSALADSTVSATLRSLGFGYRADYIQRTAKMLVDAHGSSLLSDTHGEASEVWLEGLRSLETEKAREELLKFVGVGRKVADCILLMSLDKKEVIPVDTHVHQIAVKHYGMKGNSGKTAMTPKLYDEVNNKLQSLWGDYAGWAHSVLFTADLKAFADYGLDSPEKLSSVPPAKAAQLLDDALPTPPLSPSPSPLKRKSAPLVSKEVDAPIESPKRPKRTRRT